MGIQLGLPRSNLHHNLIFILFILLYFCLFLFGIVGLFPRLVVSFLWVVPYICSQGSCAVIIDVGYIRQTVVLHRAPGVALCSGVVIPNPPPICRVLRIYLCMIGIGREHWEGRLFIRISISTLQFWGQAQAAWAFWPR
jgi:hypothetical protein